MLLPIFCRLKARYPRLPKDFSQLVAVAGLQCWRVLSKGSPALVARLSETKPRRGRFVYV